MRIGVSDAANGELSPEDLAATFEPVQDPPPPPKRIGPRLLAHIDEGDPEDPQLVIEELRDGALYAMIYVGRGRLNAHIVSGMNDQWNKWRDGKVPGPLVVGMKDFRLVEIEPGAQLLPYVAIAEERPDMPDVGDFGAITEPRDPATACQQVAELRGFLTRAAAPLVELPAHLIRDNPAQVVVELAQQYLEPIRAERAAAAARAQEAPAPVVVAKHPRWVYVAAGGGILWALAIGSALVGRSLGWW